MLATLHEGFDRAADLRPGPNLSMARESRVRREGVGIMSTLGADACVVLPRGTDQAPRQAAGRMQAEALLVFIGRPSNEQFRTFPVAARQC